jgi:predicted dehydrogenase
MTDGIGVALVGCAHTAHAWSYARALTESPSAHLVGVHDERPELAQAISAQFGSPYHPDVEALVRSPEVSAVVICSETLRHRWYVELAATAGRHVLCEKPIATSLDDAAAIVDACQDAGVQLHLAFVARFTPLVQDVRSTVQSGHLGDLISMVGGNRGRPPLPPAYPDWITQTEQSGGGALIDHSVHVTDAMRHISGLEAVSVTAEVDGLLWGCGVEDAALLSVVFDRGVVASVDPSWSVPAGNPWDYDFFPRILGTQGSMRINDTSESVRLVSGRAGGGLRLVPFGIDADAAMVEGFVASIGAGRVLEPCASGHDGVRALEIALAGYASAAAATPVQVPAR